MPCSGAPGGPGIAGLTTAARSLGEDPGHAGGGVSCPRAASVRDRNRRQPTSRPARPGPMDVDEFWGRARSSPCERTTRAQPVDLAGRLRRRARPGAGATTRRRRGTAARVDLPARGPSPGRPVVRAARGGGDRRHDHRPEHVRAGPGRLGPARVDAGGGARTRRSTTTSSCSPTTRANPCGWPAGRPSTSSPTAPSPLSTGPAPRPAGARPPRRRGRHRAAVPAGGAGRRAARRRRAGAAGCRGATVRGAGWGARRVGVRRVRAVGLGGPRPPASDGTARSLTRWSP